MIEVKVYSIASSGSSECILFLEEVNGDRLLPIWIGIAEGQAIAIRFTGIFLPRPLTHDLLLRVVQDFGWKIKQVVITDLRGQTFYAAIHLSKNGETHIVDSRPSDAIAIAVRAGCPMYVEDKIFDKCKPIQKPITEEEVGQFKEDLKNLKPEDLFKPL